MGAHVTAEEARKVQSFLRTKLNPEIVVQLRQRADECAELYLGPECLGVVQKVIDEGETSYAIEISVISEDLDEVL